MPTKPKMTESLKDAQSRYNETTKAINLRLNPRTEPELYAAWLALVEKHGGESVKGSQAAAFKEMLASKCDDDSDISIDLTSEVKVEMMMGRELLLSLAAEAEQLGLTLNDLVYQKLQTTIVKTQDGRDDTDS